MTSFITAILLMPIFAFFFLEEEMEFFEMG